MIAVYLILLCANSAFSAPSDSPYNLQSVNSFSFRLLENVAAVNEGNFAVSPLSVWNLFSLLAEGASGSTFNELMLQLELPKDSKATQALHKAVEDLLRSPNNDVTFNRKAAMFADQSLNLHQQFCQSAYSYNTDVFSVDTKNTSKLAADINYFICFATEGNIRNAVNIEMLENLKLLLVDAMYFKANWTYPFDAKQTSKEAFYDQQGRTIGEVNMMFQKAPNTVSYLQELEAEILEMTYGKNEEYSMIILQPYARSSVKKLLKGLSQKPFEEWSRKLLSDGNLPSIDCYVPRMKIATQLDLIQPLKYMGIYDIFDETRSLLPGVSNNPLFVSKTIQKVELEVNEEGTKAAAVTVVGLEDRILGQRIEINRPFVYLIVQRKADIVLFAGVYTEPAVV